MAAMLKKLSIETERPAGVSEVAALVKEGGIAALKVGPFLHLPCQLPCGHSFLNMFMARGTDPPSSVVVKPAMCSEYSYLVLQNSQPSCRRCLLCLAPGSGLPSWQDLFSITWVLISTNALHDS